MKWSKQLIQTIREVPSDAEIESHKLLIRAGFIRKVGAGLYSYLPLAMRSLKKIQTIIREEMDRTGAQEIVMPILQPSDLWRTTGRWDKMDANMFKLKDHNEKEAVLGPTAEEEVTDLVKGIVSSYRQLPTCVYQIQWKFRDETRPRFALMRSREFLMKDAYSFDTNQEDADKEYWIMYEAYKKVFSRCGIKAVPVAADGGDMGDSLTHEFHVLADSGEDGITWCEHCGYAANSEVANIPEGGPCPKCGKPVIIKRGIEVGQVFKLGTKYSDAFKAVFKTADLSEKPMIMGCYGIGVSRTLQAVIEQCHDKDGIIWPAAIAPIQVCVCLLDPSVPEVTKVADGLEAALEAQGIDVIVDDREERPGVKFKDADLIGFPVRVVVGAKSLANGGVEIKRRADDKSKTQIVKPEDAIAAIKSALEM